MNKKSLKNLLSIFCPMRYREGILILNYHSINPGHEYSTKPEDFEAQMRYLSYNFNVIKLSEIYNKNSGFYVVITFDDGFADNYDYAFSILKKYKLPATIFLVSDFVFEGVDITRDWIPYRGLKSLNKEMIKDMSGSELIDFGLHGKNHDDVSTKIVELFKRELIEAKGIIEKHSGKKVVSYAFPFGQKLQRGIFDLKFFNEIGLLYICTTDWGVNKFSNNYKFLKRIRIDSGDTISEFKEKIKGSWDFVSFFQYLKNIKCGVKKY